MADFDLEARLGEGSYSEVFQVRLKTSGVRYALKVVDKHLVLRHRAVHRLKRERNILDRCAPPSVAQLFFTFQDEASVYLGLELCPNGELYDQIHLAGTLPLETARVYTAEVVLMLVYLRELGVVHRDLKPENLLLDTAGHLKLVDFGSADDMQSEAEKEPSERRNDLERRSSLTGTADYLSPEALRGESVSYPADLWALGCIIYQMLVGKPPFRGASEYLTFQLVAAGEYSVPDALDPSARDVIGNLLLLNPQQRLGAGVDGLAALQQHPFFDDISWENLLNQDAPQFVPLEPRDSYDSGLDWDLTSFAGATPVAFTYTSSGLDSDNKAEVPSILDAQGQPDGARDLDDGDSDLPGNQDSSSGARPEDDRGSATSKAVEEQLEDLTLTDCVSACNTHDVRSVLSDALSERLEHI